MSISEKRLAPKRPAAPFKDPEYELSIDWLAARDAVHAAQLRHLDARGPARIH